VDAKGNNFTRNLIQEKYYQGKIINDNIRVLKNGDSYLLNLDDGFISLPLKNTTVVDPIKIEAFDNGNLVVNDSKIKYNSELKVNVISGIYGSNKPSLFIRQIMR
jgi:hypothetical protein